MHQFCIFCGSPLGSNRTDEDIFPKWLAKKMDLSKLIVDPTHILTSGEVKDQRNHPISQLLCGNICSKCNNGWMSDLEQENMALISNLVFGKKDIREIQNTNDAFRLSVWACKTAYSLHAASNWRKIIPVSHYRALSGKVNMIYPGVSVTGMTIKGANEFSWAQDTSWEIIDESGLFTEKDRKIIYDSAYKICIRFGCLFLSVVYNPFRKSYLRNVQLIFNSNLHTPLHPKSGPCAWKSNEITLSSNPTTSVFQFNAAIGILFFQPTSKKRFRIKIPHLSPEILTMDSSPDLN